jgi:anthranilate synthase component 1
MLKLTDAGRDAFILESVTGGEVRGRYSIIGMKPDLIWECRGADSRVNRTARYDRDAFEPCEAPPLEALRGLWPSPPSTCPPTCPPPPRGSSAISATT